MKDTECQANEFGNDLVDAGASGEVFERENVTV